MNLTNSMASLMRISTVARIYPYHLVDVDPFFISEFFKVSNPVTATTKFSFGSFGPQSCGQTRSKPFEGPSMHGSASIQLVSSFNDVANREVVPHSSAFMAEEAPAIIILMGQDAYKHKDADYFRYVGFFYRFNGFWP